MLLPMYFLIGIWGGPRREYAAIKFFLYTLLGWVLMLLAMLALYYYAADADLRHDQAVRRNAGITALQFPAHRLDRAVHRFRDQDSGVPVPHLACPTRTSKRRRRSP